MNALLHRLLLRPYPQDGSRSSDQAASLAWILLGLGAFALAMLPILSQPADRLFIGLILAVVVGSAVLLRLGRRKFAALATVVLLAIVSSLVVLTDDIQTYIDMYQLAFFQMFVVGLTLLISDDRAPVLLTTGIGVLTLLINFFFRAMPAQLGGESPDADDLVVCVLLLFITGLVVNGSNRRSLGLFSKLEQQNARSAQRAAQLQNIVREFQSKSTAGEELVDYAEETDRVVGQLRDTVGAIQERADRVKSGSEGLREATDGIQSAAEQVSDAGNEHSQLIDETSSSITEMSAAIQNISRISSERKDSVSRLSTQGRNTEKVLNESVTSMNNLKELISSLSEVNTVISSVSAQTRLLAMNAAIEAAHAGESGRGFAVVAEEVRTLADNSASNAKRVTGILKDITESVEQANRTNEEVFEAVRKVGTEIAAVVDSFEEIIAGMKELSAGTSEVDDRTAKSVSSTRQIKSAIAEVATRIEEIGSKLSEQERANSEVLSAAHDAVEKLNVVGERAASVKRIGNVNAGNLKELSEKLSDVEGGEDRA